MLNRIQGLLFIVAGLVALYEGAYTAWLVFLVLSCAYDITADIINAIKERR